MAELSLVNISKTYNNGYCAVDDFSMDIEDKEFIILVGPSGCGKSTLLRMIAGLEEITTGELWIDGQLVNALSPKERDLSMVFQNYALYPHMTVFENMAFSLRVRKFPQEEITRRVLEAAEILDIAHLLGRKPGVLSGGQKQRVAIGSIIVRKSRVYLMDEPLSNLDAKLRAQMRIELIKLHKRMDGTVIYVTHDQVEAMTLGTRIVVMNQGVVQQVDSPARLYQYPVNKFVAGFIGSPAMNFIPAKISGERDEIHLLIDGQRFDFMAAQKRQLHNHASQDSNILLGVRPEDFRECTDREPCVRLPVSVREMMGAEVFLYGELCGSEICVRLEPECTAKKDETICLTIDMERISLFDLVTERNILFK